MKDTGPRRAETILKIFLLMLRFTMCPQEARKCNSGGETDPQINRIEILAIDLHKYDQLIFEVQRWMKDSL